MLPTKNKQLLIIGVLALLVAFMFAPQLAHAQAPIVSYDLCATASNNLTGNWEIVAGTSVPIWGYADITVSGVCDDTVVPELPGPVLTVAQGDEVHVTLHNNLGEATALYFPGQAMIPDLMGAVANGDTAVYTFTAGQAGTFLYEAGLLPNAQHQVAMGLYGMLVVTDTVPYDVEAPVVLSEIDPALNSSADPAAFDMRDYAPKYWLINGKAYPDTATIAAAAGDSLLLRYANAGLYPHSMGLMGLEQTLMANDGSPLPYARKVVVQNIAPGQTMDMAVQMPSPAPTGGSEYALYDTNLLLHNDGAAGFGGMMTFISLADGGPGPGTGPTTTSVSLSPASTTSPTPVALSAIIPSATGAEVFIDTQGADGTGGVMSPGLGTDEWIASLDTTGLITGDHTVYVHGTDGTWGSFNFAVLHLDNDGPMTKALVLSPNPSNGLVPVNLTATGDDTTTGGSNISAAEYFVGGPGINGDGTPMSINQTAPIASLSATIPAPGSSGTVFVHSQDSFGHWGQFATIDLWVDSNGPAASAVTVTPNLMYTRVAARVDATLTDVGDTVKKAEGFINFVGADGTGFPLTPRDGLFNESSEDAYATIPLATINSLPAGVNTFYVHGQDSSGNWGDANLASAILTIMPEAIFADGFESGDFSAWTGGTGGSPTVSAAAARPPSNSGMQVALSGTSLTGYAIDNSPDVDPSYHARFYFNPNSTETGNNAQPDIFVGYDAGSTALFRVQYQRTQGGNPTYRVRAVVTRAGGTTTSGWVNITNNWTAVEIAWQSANPATFRLYVNGILRQSITGVDTSAYKLETVWLGPSGNLGNNVLGTMYFDDFVSKRTQYIGP